MIPLTHNSPCGHLIYPLHFPGNGLFETLISPIQRKTSLLYTYTALILTQPIFETLVFVITIQKISSDSPVSIHLLCTFNKSNQNGGLPIPLGICLLEASIHFSSNGSTHLVYAYTSHPSAQPLFETFIFIITIQKYPQKTTHFHPHFCLFVTNQFSNFPSQRRLSHKNKGRKSLANHLFISHSSHFIGKKRKHCHSLRQLFSWSARIKVKFVL